MYVTYTLEGPNGQTYSGRASGFGTPEQVMWGRYATHHMRLQGYHNPTLDVFAQGVGNYGAIRGREQQLIDRYGGVGSPQVGNSIRGVSRYNPAGRAYHWMSNYKFGPFVKMKRNLNTEQEREALFIKNWGLNIIDFISSKSSLAESSLFGMYKDAFGKATMQKIIESCGCVKIYERLKTGIY